MEKERTMPAPVTTAPTEAEIRAAIMTSAAKYSNHGRDKLSEAVMEYVDDLRWRAGDPDLDPDPESSDPGRQESGDALWRDLRPSEVDRLKTLLWEAEQRATASAHELIVSEYVAGVLAFALEYPDAPRTYLGADGHMHPGPAPEAAPAALAAR
jgi:hypothetical protein